MKGSGYAGLGPRLLGGACLALLSCAHAAPGKAPKLRVEERLEELGPGTFRLSAARGGAGA